MRRGPGRGSRGRISWREQCSKEGQRHQQCYRWWPAARGDLTSAQHAAGERGRCWRVGPQLQCDFFIF
jgi:hypothetical protein